MTDDGIDIIGIGTHPSKGLRKGVVVNIDATVASIKRAIEEAEHMAGCEITTVYTGIAGGHIKALQLARRRRGQGQGGPRSRTSTASSTQAKAVAIPLDREVIHVLPQEFIVDDQDGIKEPLGMAACASRRRCTSSPARSRRAQNIVKCAQPHRPQRRRHRAAAARVVAAVLSDDEKELGVCLVDIGGGTTDIAIFHDGSIVHTAVIALGGNHLTNDIAVGLRTPTHEAERIKQQYGCAMALDGRQGRDDRGAERGRRPAARALAPDPRARSSSRASRRSSARPARDAEVRLEELLASGVVITGGSTLLAGMPEMAEEVLGMPVRRGMPRGIGGLVDVVKSPMYATGVGLVDVRRPAAGPAPVLQDPRGERLPEGEEPDEGVARGDLLDPRGDVP